MTWCKRIVIFFCIFIIFSFNFISPFTYSVLGRTKTDMILKNFWKIIVPLPIKRWKQYLPTLFCEFFSQKWNIPSLIASFRGRLDGTFAEKNFFLLITHGKAENVRWFWKNQKRSINHYCSQYFFKLLSYLRKRFQYDFYYFP